MGVERAIRSRPARSRIASGIELRLVTDEEPADPFAALGVRPSAPMPAMIPTKSAPPVVDARAGVLFPSLAPAVVYAAGPLPVWSRRRSAGRAVRTTGAMAALAAGLWWAVARLGEGLSALMDLFGGPPAPGG